MPAQNDNRTAQGSPTSGRKAYQAPELCRYGDVGEITQTISAMGSQDANNMTRTN
jgi:hypothetical protein